MVWYSSSPRFVQHSRNSSILDETEVTISPFDVTLCSIKEALGVVRNTITKRRQLEKMKVYYINLSIFYETFFQTL